MGTENKRISMHGAAGFLVHVLTASGGAVALLALYAAIERDFPATFGWLGLAMFIDGVILDLVIDFLAYVVTPVVALWRSDLMPTSVAFWIGLVVTIASALYFADTRMKTSDKWFRGFPALWNVAVFYLFVFRPPWPIGAAAILIGVAAMFAPIVYVHPFRVVRMRALTIAATLAWCALAGLAVWQRLDADLWVRLGLAATAVYFLALPLVRDSPWAGDRRAA
jgi:phosphatidylcholine synthase